MGLKAHWYPKSHRSTKPNSEQETRISPENELCPDLEVPLRSSYTETPLPSQNLSTDSQQVMDRVICESNETREASRLIEGIDVPLLSREARSSESAFSVLDASRIMPEDGGHENDIWFENEELRLATYKDPACAEVHLTCEEPQRGHFACTCKPGNLLQRVDL